MVETYQNILSMYFNTDMPLFRFEAQILQFLIMPSLFLWNNTFLQHPSYPRGPWGRMKEKGKKAIIERMNISNNHRVSALERGMPQLSNYLARLDVELQYGQSPVPAKWVEELKCQYATSRDHHNPATMKMLEADYTLSPPFSNPIALNLIVYQGSNPEFTVGPWDNLEGEWKLGEVPTAKRLYSEALELFAVSASPRGQAAALLRQGYVEHM